MAGFAVAAAYVQDVTPLVAALATETLYLATVPASSIYRRLVDRREKQRLLKLRDQQREAQIKLFDPREREAVEYLRWMKNQIYSNYKKFTGTKADSAQHSKSGSALGRLRRSARCLSAAQASPALDQSAGCAESTGPGRARSRRRERRSGEDAFNRRTSRFSNAVWLRSMTSSVR